MKTSFLQKALSALLAMVVLVSFAPAGLGQQTLSQGEILPNDPRIPSFFSTDGTAVFPSSSQKENSPPPHNPDNHRPFLVDMPFGASEEAFRAFWKEAQKADPDLPEFEENPSQDPFLWTVKGSKVFYLGFPYENLVAFFDNQQLFSLHLSSFDEEVSLDDQEALLDLLQKYTPHIDSLIGLHGTPTQAYLRDSSSSATYAPPLLDNGSLDVPTFARQLSSLPLGTYLSLVLCWDNISLSLLGKYDQNSNQISLFILLSARKEGVPLLEDPS
ncbi:MAG: hypothetical protein GX786_02555, partial [Clostridiales bacterium]|nr:hypothetical protein [Clostridiales bacterium]